MPYSVTADQICELLQLLSQDHTPSGDLYLDGQIFLVNLWDSCEGKDPLVKTQDVLAFLADCVCQTFAPTVVDAVSVVKTIATSNVKSGAPIPRYRRLRQQTAIEEGSRFSTVTTYEEFVTYICKEDPTRVQPPKLPAAAPDAPKDMQELEREIGLLTAKGGWFRSDAALGGPLPAPQTCWISVNRFTDADSTSVYDGSESPADRVRDELGIVLDNGMDHLVRYSFSAESAAAAAAQDMAQPTFADAENLRFRARHSCERGQEMARAGWGSAVHLGRLPNPQLHPPTGKAMRVSRPLKVSQLRNLNVDYLHCTRFERGATIYDDDKAFLALLLGPKRTPQDVVGQLICFVRENMNAEDDAP